MRDMRQMRQYSPGRVVCFGEGRAHMAFQHPLLKAYLPTLDDPFDAIKAAHLLNRAGFGATQAEIRKVMELGPTDAVDWLLDFPDAGADEQSTYDLPGVVAIEGYPNDYHCVLALMPG